jgi:hypothetical protein
VGRSLGEPGLPPLYSAVPEGDVTPSDNSDGEGLAKQVRRRQRPEDSPVGEELGAPAGLTQASHDTIPGGSPQAAWQPSVLWQPPSVTEYIAEMERKVQSVREQRTKLAAAQGLCILMQLLRRWGYCGYSGKPSWFPDQPQARWSASTGGGGGEAACVCVCPTLGADQCGCVFAIPSSLVPRPSPLAPLSPCAALVSLTTSPLPLATLDGPTVGHVQACPCADPQLMPLPPSHPRWPPRGGSQRPRTPPDPPSTPQGWRPGQLSPPPAGRPCGTWPLPDACKHCGSERRCCSGARDRRPQSRWRQSRWPQSRWRQSRWPQSRWPLGWRMPRLSRASLHTMVIALTLHPPP